MAVPTQFACMLITLLRPHGTNSLLLDRTAKGIGITDAAPVHQALSDFERCSNIHTVQSYADEQYSDPKATYDVVSIHLADATLHGLPQRSKQDVWLDTCIMTNLY